MAYAQFQVRDTSFGAPIGISANDLDFNFTHTGEEAKAKLVLGCAGSLRGSVRALHDLEYGYGSLTGLHIRQCPVKGILTSLELGAGSVLGRTTILSTNLAIPIWTSKGY